jgi:hypothetical protein
MSGSPGLDGSVCGDGGRQMFFDYVGRYFAFPPRLRPLPAGTSCPRCGSTTVQLWMTASNEPSCLAQQTITRKRRARASADEPAVPPKDSSGKTNMGDGSMVVAGPHTARIITKILPDMLPPPFLEIVFTKEGSIRGGILDLLQDAPEPPFVVIIFEKKAKFTTKITVDRSQIVINGTKPQVINRSRMDRLLAISQQIGRKEFYRLMELRHRLAGGEPTTDTQRERDRDALLAMRASLVLSPAEFRSLPAPRSGEADLLRKLLD